MFGREFKLTQNAPKNVVVLNSDEDEMVLEELEHEEELDAFIKSKVKEGTGGKSYSELVSTSLAPPPSSDPDLDSYESTPHYSKFQQ